MRRTYGLRICLWLVMAIGAPIWASASAFAAPPVVGIVTDYQPRFERNGIPAVGFRRDGKLYPLRENEIIYEGDEIVFTVDRETKAFAKILVDATTEIRLDPSRTGLPHPRWPVLQALWPQLVAAYRWMHSASSSDDAELENAVSRGLDDGEVLSVLPNASGGLIISESSADPLWLGWEGGAPPFTLTASSNGKVIAKSVVCAKVAEKACRREGTIDLNGASGDIEVMLDSADGTSWTGRIKRAPIAWTGQLADVSAAGNLGRFLRATDLLDRGHGEYVLESARELVPIAPNFPPARTLLDHIRDGKVP